MSEKKNIDRLFQEKFKDFEAAPPDFVWDNLEEILQEKKKRRVIPIWIRLGGVAAALVVGMLFLYPYFTADTPGSGVVYDTPQTGTGNKTQTNPAGTGTPAQPNRNVQGTGPASNPNAIVSGPGNATSPINTAQDNASAGTQQPATGTPGSGNKSGIKAGTGNSALAHGTTNNNNSKNKGGSRNNKYNSNGQHNPANNKHNANPQYQEGGIASNGSRNNKPGTANDNDQNGTAGNAVNPVSGNRLQQENQNNGVAQNGNPTGQPDANNGQQETDSQQTGNDLINRDIPLVPITPDEALAQTPVDTTAVQETDLEKRQRELEEEKANKALAQNDSDATKWNVKPQMGPLLYSSLGNGSPIDAQFASNSKSYDNQLSFGVGVNYALTDKLSVRSGINTVNLSYATEGVQFYASLNQGTNNVARTGSANIVVVNGGQQSPTTLPTVGFNSDQLPQEKFNGSMLQKTGYIEVPLEMSYALLNKKFGIDIIGGVSTLFLNENNVSVISSQGLSTDVGRAQNLNNIHFSTNLGVGFKYKFFKQFQASFEPTFKYQLNAYSRDAGNFKPYFIGLYTGISFSF